jgi:hypothetical protein
MQYLYIPFTAFHDPGPTEVESAKLRRFVLIPIEKLKLSRNRHDGTQMMSFLYFVVVRP